MHNFLCGSWIVEAVFRGSVGLSFSGVIPSAFSIEGNWLSIIAKPNIGHLNGKLICGCSQELTKYIDAL